MNVLDLPFALLFMHGVWCPFSTISLWLGSSKTDNSTWIKHSVVTIASEPASIDYDRSFEKNRDVDSMSHGHVD